MFKYYLGSVDVFLSKGLFGESLVSMITGVSTGKKVKKKRIRAKMYVEHNLGNMKKMYVPSNPGNMKLGK